MQSIRETGLVLHSDRDGEFTVHPWQTIPINEIGPQDYIFICVKNYSLEEICHSLSQAVTNDTVIIPIMNGVDPGDRVRKMLPQGTVVDSLIYIIAYANQDYSITQLSPLAKPVIGIQNADESQWEKVQEVSALLENAGIDYAADRNVQREIWRKYILNCAYNVTTAFYDHTIGQIRNNPSESADYESLVHEAWQVALKKGIDIRPEHIDRILEQFHNEYPDNATSSLQRDIDQGKQTELETFSGYLVREANRLQVKVPVSARMYEGLKKKTV